MAIRDTRFLGGRKLWLASYPRSGNTYLRIVLKEIFDLHSTSVYIGEDVQFSDKPTMLQRIGHVEEPCVSEELIAIKTHEPPCDDEKAIYCIRDGRASIASYFHYLNRIDNSTASLEQTITGEIWGGSWTDHYKSWNPLKRPNTMFVRYDDLVLKLPETIKMLGSFLGMEPKTMTVESNFDVMNGIYPDFFSVGNDRKRIREVAAFSSLFNNIHGALMLELGYFRDEADMEQWAEAFLATDSQ